MRSTLSSLLLLLLAAAPSLVGASCGHGLSTVHPFNSQRGRRSDEHAAIEPPAFGYDVARGPLLWHTLAPDNALCATGTRQSPIIIQSVNQTLAPKGSVKLHVPPAHDVLFENIGTTVETVIGGSLEASGKTWELAQFHFHTPSEHRVDLAHYEAEMHMVFEAPDASIAVLSFLVDATAFESNAVLEQVLAFLPAVQEPLTSVVIPAVDFGPFLAEIADFDYFVYSGSLTTPPCSESVAWHIATTPLKLRAETFRALKATTKTNNRFSQADPGTGSVLLMAAESALALAADADDPAAAHAEASSSAHARRGGLYW